jgi:ABC-type sugar transport system ATPase subunit
VDVRAPSINTLVQKLSGGNQQKIVLAKWLMRSPKVLLLDEPTRGIDVGAKYEIYKIMMELVKEGIAIVMISSELPELLSMTDRIIILAGGGIRGEADAKECTQEMIMKYATE